MGPTVLLRLKRREKKQAIAASCALFMLINQHETTLFRFKAQNALNQVRPSKIKNKKYFLIVFYLKNQCLTLFNDTT